MNLLNQNRKVRHSQNRVDRLCARRLKAKNKVGWDVMYGAVMDSARETLAADKAELASLLKAEGYYRWAQ